MRKIVFAAAIIGSAFQVSGMNNGNIRNEWTPGAVPAHGILKGGSTFHENANQDSPKKVRFAKNDLSEQDRRLIEQGINPASEIARELMFRIDEEHVPFFMAHLTDNSWSAVKELESVFAQHVKQELNVYKRTDLFQRMDKTRKKMVKKAFSKRIRKMKAQMSDCWLEQQDQITFDDALNIFPSISMSNISKLMSKLSDKSSGDIKYFLSLIDKSPCENASGRLKLIAMEKWCLDQLPAEMNIYEVLGIINVVSTQNIFALLDKISNPSDENIRSLALCSKRHEIDIVAWKLNRSIKSTEKFDVDIAAEFIHKMPLSIINTHVPIMINNILDRLSEKSLKTVLSIFNYYKYDEIKVKSIKKWLGVNYPQPIEMYEILPFVNVLPALILRGSFRKLQNMSMDVAGAMLSDTLPSDSQKVIVGWIKNYGVEE